MTKLSVIAAIFIGGGGGGSRNGSSGNTSENSRSKILTKSLLPVTGFVSVLFVCVFIVAVLFYTLYTHFFLGRNLK